VQGVKKLNMFRVQREETCQGEDTHRVTEYSGERLVQGVHEDDTRQSVERQPSKG
jgi:hypothetical protein